MEIKTLHDKTQIYSYLKKQPELHAYCIGDLDDFFWPKTIWYALVQGDAIESLALVYTGMEKATLLAFYQNDADKTKELLLRIKAYLPQKFYAHLSPGLVEVFGKENVIKYYGLDYKMALKSVAKDVDEQNIRRLSVNDLEKLQNLYAQAYPNNWFDKRMLETGKYFGYFFDEKIVGVAGIHVYSKQYKVAALGNIAVSNNYRGMKIANKLTSKLCFDLSKDVDYIGLNVKSDNVQAIKCYQNIGFEIIGQFDECFINNQSD
jgi:ribosomal protein S18 acetylase RimI-like enzyme